MTPQTGHTSERHPITQPIRSFISIGISIVVVILLLVFLGSNSNPETGPDQSSLELFFEPRNRVINGFILSLLTIGIALILYELVTLSREVSWLKDLQIHVDGKTVQADVDALPPMPNQLLAPVKALFADRHNIGSLDTQSSKAILDAIASRVEERRELVRWLIQTLILSGLIGTFWGLFGTIDQIGNIVKSINSPTLDISGTQTEGSETISDSFGSLLTNLEPAMDSMAIAFSSSLLGLAGSLLLGFFELQTGGAQNRFVGELEDWLYSITRMRTASLLEAETNGSDWETFSQQTIKTLRMVAENQDNMRETMNTFRSTVQSGHSERAVEIKNLVALGQQIRDFTERYTADQAQMRELAANVNNFNEFRKSLSEQTESLSNHTEVIVNQSFQFAEWAQELKVMEARDETANHLRRVSQEIEQLSRLVIAQTETVQLLSDRDAQNLNANLEHLGHVIVQATDRAAHNNAAMVVRAIQLSGHETVQGSGHVES